MNKPILILIITAMAGLFLWWFLSRPANAPISDVQQNTIESQIQDSRTEVKPQPKIAISEPEANPYEDAVIKAQVQQIADLYEQNSQYPITSQPIRNPEDVREYSPFEESEVDLPFPDDSDDGDPIRLIAATDKYQYFQGDTIQARVTIVNAPADDFKKITGVLSGAKGDLPSNILFETSADQANTFLASFDTRVATTELFSNDMLLKISVTVGERELFTTVGLRYTNPSAQLTGLGLVQPQGAELVIPAQLSVIQSGYYFLSAVLEDAASNQALLQLQNEGRLNSGNAILPLTAHISALRAASSEGPYRLRQIKVIRGAETGESSDVSGSSIASQFDIPGFAFSNYDDESFEDPQAQERIDFLRGIGNAEPETPIQE